MTFPAGVRYVSFGLSRDDRMGEDSVLECIVEDGSIRAYSSWNHPRSNTRDQVVGSMENISIS